MEKKAYMYEVVKEDLVEKCFLCGSSNSILKLYKIQINQKHIIFLHVDCLTLISVFTEIKEFSEIKRYFDNKLFFRGYSYSKMKKEKERALRFDCCICKRKGAFVKCAERGCGNNFHLPCGLLEPSKTLHSFTTFKSRCPEHSCRCSVCLENVTGYVKKAVCNPSCCGRKAFFHENCIQLSIMNAGRLVECVNCRNVDKFKKEAMESGMDISSRNPSYAEEPRYSYGVECTAAVCVCKNPSGRVHHVNSGKSPWEIVTCIYCGHGSIHRKCGNLGRNKRWTCNSCFIVSTRNSAVGPNASGSSVD